MPVEVRARPAFVGQTRERPLSILIVDDDEATAEVLTTRLTRHGFEILTSRTGGEGLALARDKRPDLILLDLCLPDREGFEIGEELNDSPTTCHIPVIVLSGLEGPDVVRRSRAAGCHYYLSKPYDPNVLLVLIQQALADAEDWMDE